MKFIVATLLGIPEVVAIVSAIVIVLGIAIFLCTGFIHVKKDHIAIIERVDVYVGMQKKRWAYYTPIVYRRAGYYYLGTNQRDMTLPNEIKARLFYKIDDVLLYHYSGHDIKSTIDRYYFLNGNRLNVDILKQALTSIGLVFVEIVELDNK